MPVRADSMFILADDLSGAADCAVGGVRAGLTSVVLLDDSACGPAQVIAIDADTRHRSPRVSRAVNAALWRSHSAPGRLFYKKIDSTLRGNFATDMSALAGAGVAIVAPAFPASGRTTRDGRVFVNGEPLASHRDLVEQPDARRGGHRRNAAGGGHPLGERPAGDCSRRPSS